MTAENKPNFGKRMALTFREYHPEVFGTGFGIWFSSFWQPYGSIVTYKEQALFGLAIMTTSLIVDLKKLALNNTPNKR